LNIHLTSTYIEYDDKNLRSIGRFLAGLVDMLGMAFDSRDAVPTKLVKLDFRLKEANDLDNEPSLPVSSDSRTKRYRKIWYRTQVASAVKQMRKTLAFRVPALNLTSNVENRFPDLRSQKTNWNRVLLQHTGNGDRRILLLWANGASCIAKQEAEFDGHD
jgi:hypothetical protein